MGNLGNLRFWDNGVSGSMSKLELLCAEWKAVCILDRVKNPHCSLRSVCQRLIHYFQVFYLNEVLLGYFKWLTFLLIITQINIKKVQIQTLDVYLLLQGFCLSFSDHMESYTTKFWYPVIITLQNKSQLKVSKKEIGRTAVLINSISVKFHCL